MTPANQAAPAATDVSRSVAEIVCDVIERPTVDPTVDLFDQGVSSLALTRIVVRLNEHFGIQMDVLQLEEASVDAMSGLVRRQTSGEHRPETVED